MSVRFGSTGFWAGAKGLAWVASIIGIVGCASPRLRLDAEAEPPGTSFRDTFTRWTRDGSAVSIQDLDTTLLVSATLRGRSFQRAYIDRYLQVYKITDPAERARVESEQSKLTESGVNFWVRTASHDGKWNDLMPTHGRWRVTLIDPKGQELPAETVTEVVREGLVETAMHGQLPDVYRRIWRVRFPPLPTATEATQVAPPGSPQTEGEKRITLRFTGPGGKVDLVWLVE